MNDSIRTDLVWKKLSRESECQFFSSESNLSDPSEISVHVLWGKEEPRSQNDVDDDDDDDGSKASVACLGLVFDLPDGNRSTLVVGVRGQISLQKYCRRDTG